MCSSGRLCSGSSQSPSSTTRSTGSSSGSQYALCTLGVGLVALGVVMIVWSVVPADAVRNNSNSRTQLDDADQDLGKTSSVAFVLVGAGVGMLLLAICLCVRDKKRPRLGEGPVSDHANGELAELTDEPSPRYDVPSYEEAVGSGQYPVRQSNLHHSTSQLPSYEDLVDAVEKEREESAQPPPGPVPADAAPQPSRSSRILRPFKVRRMMSEKLHLKDVRLNAPNPPQGVRPNIEPLTPPPLYEDKMPEL